MYVVHYTRVPDTCTVFAFRLDDIDGVYQRLFEPFVLEAGMRLLATPLLKVHSQVAQLHATPLLPFHLIFHSIWPPAILSSPLRQEFSPVMYVRRLSPPNASV